MDLVNNEVTDLQLCNFIMNECIVLVCSSHFRTKQKNLVHSGFCLSPNVMASESGCHKCLCSELGHLCSVGSRPVIQQMGKIDNMMTLNQKYQITLKKVCGANYQCDRARTLAYWLGGMILKWQFWAFPPSWFGHLLIHIKIRLEKIQSFLSAFSI